MLTRFHDQRSGSIGFHAGHLDQIVHSQVGQVVAGGDGVFGQLTHQVAINAFQGLELFRDALDFFFRSNGLGQ